MLKHILPGIAALCLFAAPVSAQQSMSMARFTATPPQIQSVPEVTGALTACSGGSAAGYDCSNVDLLSVLPLSAFGSSATNDIWGWTDPITSHEYALIGLNDGTGFVDVTDPVNPVYLGKLPTHTTSSSWRDIKVYAGHAFIVSEANLHGMQVFDLTNLRSVASPPVTFSETAHYSGVNDVHNIVINESTGFAYAVGNNNGGTTCSGGLHMINIQDPENPTFAGCFSSDGYTHDAQCVTYTGPDTAHDGAEICFALNEDTITIVDVTNKAAPAQLSRVGYPGSAYVHQGWLSENQEIFYQDDELDTGNTRTVIWDVTDLDDPVVDTSYYAAHTSYDHNQYVVGSLLFQTNYTVGLRILDITNPVAPVEVGYFDTYTLSNAASFNGAWSNYPFFASGTVVVSSIGEGLFVLGPNISGNTPPDVTITAPLDGSSHPFGGEITFSGTAQDDSDGEISSGLSWTSDLDGGIGSGAGFATSSLSVGTHQITASVSDSEGAPGSDQISITIDPPPIEDVHVDNIILGTQGAGKKVKGTATVLIHNNLDGLVPGAVVTGTFSGAFNETKTGTTGSDGSVSFVTSGRSSSNSFNFCVNDVESLFPYDSADNAQSSFSCDNGGGTDPPTSFHITLISTGQQGGRGGIKSGTASVTVVDNFGTPVTSASVSGTFSGDFDETAGPTLTGSDGTANFVTNGSKKGNVTISFCVSSITHASLTYDSAGNADPSYVCLSPGAFSDRLPKSGVPSGFSLLPNYPNPYNPGTVLSFTLPEAMTVSLKVYDALGRQVASLVDGFQSAGVHSAYFDASRLGAGTYLYVIQGGGRRISRHMTLLK